MIKKIENCVTKSLSENVSDEFTQLISDVAAYLGKRLQDPNVIESIKVDELYIGSGGVSTSLENGYLFMGHVNNRNGFVVSIYTGKKMDVANQIALAQVECSTVLRSINSASRLSYGFTINATNDKGQEVSITITK